MQVTMHAPTLRASRPFTSCAPCMAPASCVPRLAVAAQLSSFGSAAAGASAAALRTAGRRYTAGAPAPRSRSSPGGGASVLVRASWGAPVEWAPAKVLSNEKVADQLHSLVVDVGAERAAGYTKAGQFVQLKVGDSKPGFFAIASAPSPNNLGALELLIKAQGETAEALTALAAGAQVDASPVMGKGFAVDGLTPADAPQLLLFATGSGISPIKALIESGALQADKRADVRLYYGTRDAGSTAYSSLVGEWQAAGVKVIQVYSGDGQKYVQDVFAAEAGIKDPAGVGVVLCGHKDMCNKVKELVAEAGVAPERVLLNF